MTGAAIFAVSVKVDTSLSKSTQTNVAIVTVSVPVAGVDRSVVAIVTVSVPVAGVARSVMALPLSSIIGSNDSRPMCIEERRRRTGANGHGREVCSAFGDRVTGL